MTDKEAVIAFERQLKAAQAVLDTGFGNAFGESSMIYDRRKEMAEVAISALLERIEREKSNS